MHGWFTLQELLRRTGKAVKNLENKITRTRSRRQIHQIRLKENNHDRNNTSLSGDLNKDKHLGKIRGNLHQRDPNINNSTCNPRIIKEDLHTNREILHKHISKGLNNKTSREHRVKFITLHPWRMK
ncbi:hypothetical protein BVC80_1307g11 [Macleaya cordata]|uniref:Uncharacterized protein n=1 Tax=Macleaya cordata TaxID=56857 RepID=A0A200R377_MACCD|nr:hypothetical protein BVC80_1307g11 [Macleaya cordata]